MIEDILTRLIDKIENRYYGKYKGYVTDNNDPDGLGRIKATVPQLFGDQEIGWCLPCIPYGGAKELGLFALPQMPEGSEKGAGVWIEFEGGDLSHPIWSGTWWSSSEIPEQASAKKKVFKTEKGHKFIIDDENDVIEIVHNDGPSLKIDSKSIMIKNGSMSIELTDRAIKINDKSLEVT